jgi:hypothetical protein
VQNFSISIQTETRIDELKANFGQYFPYLKWEFFSAPHSAHQGNPKKEMINHNPKIKDISSGIISDKIHFSDETTVQDLEKLIAQQFGLWVQVFRKSGSIWLETTVTDEWTLAFQNEQGRELSEQLERKK